MATTLDTTGRDVMLVCRNGHVITDRLRTCPETEAVHCDRCGAVTLDRCPTCGQPVPGAVHLPGLLPVGHPRPPAYCSLCGAAFPWTHRPAPAPPPLAALETMLRRLPRVVHELRVRHGDRPPFRVADLYDLEDLLRAVLPLCGQEVRPLGRVPSYAAATRTDFLLLPPAGGRAFVLTPKWVRADLTEAVLSKQWDEDVSHHEGQRHCGVLVAFVYDPEGRLRDPAALEAAWSRPRGDVELRCVVAGVSPTGAVGL
jgi:hypothetical protein